MDWLPVSAAALVTGATALFFGAQILPRPTGDGELLRLAQDNSEEWVGLAILLTVAAVGIIVGLPCLFTLFQGKGFRSGVAACVCLCVGAVMLAAMAQVLVVFRALALEGAIDTTAVDAVVDDPLQQALLRGGFLVFYAGEALLVLALLRADTTPSWVPWCFIVHLGLVPLGATVAPEAVRDFAVLFLTAGFAGAGITANRIGRT